MRRDGGSCPLVFVPDFPGIGTPWFYPLGGLSRTGRFVSSQPSESRYLIASVEVHSFVH